MQTTNARTVVPRLPDTGDAPTEEQPDEPARS